MKNAIKDKKLITREYVGKLRQWIELNQEAYFQKENEADHWRDFCYFNKPTDREHLVMNDEVMLVDREIDGKHCYVICRILGKAENPKPKVEHVAWVIDIESLNRNYWKNGYFLLPNLD